MKTSTRLALLSLIVVSSLAFADEPETVGGGEGMRRSGYLLDASPQERHMSLAVHAVIPYGYIGLGYFPIGVGGVFYIPLVKDGFIPPVNDEFGIDFGADIVFFPGFGGSSLAFWIPVSALWTFHFTDTFSAYLKVGIALRIWPGYINAVYPDFTTAVGLNWMFARSVGLRAELGYPGIKVGILFKF